MSIEGLRAQADSVKHAQDQAKQTLGFRTDSGIWIPNTGSQMNPHIDPLARQSPRQPIEWPMKYLTWLSEGVWFCRHIAGILSEDVTKNGFDIIFDPVDEQRSKDIVQRLEDLDAKSYIQDAMWDEIVYGDGLLSMGVKGGDADPTLEVDTTQVQDILYLERYCRDGHFEGITLEKDRLSAQRGQPKSFKVKIDEESIELHASRALHFQTRARVSSKFGLPFFIPIWSVVQGVENLVWSLGQLAFNLSTRVIQSDELLGGLEERTKLIKDLEDTFNSLSLLVLGKDETLTSSTNSPGNLKYLIDFTWDLAAAATRINRSRLLGAQAGKLSSSQSDLRRYYEMIKARQESHMRKPLRKLVELLLTASGTGGVSKKSSTPAKYVLEFKSAETLTRTEQVAAEEKEAERFYKETQGFQALVTGMQTLMDMGIIDGETGQLMISKVFGTGEKLSLMEKLFAEK